MQIPGCFVHNEREAGSFESNCSGGQVFLFGFLGFNLKSAPRFFQSEVTKKCTFGTEVTATGENEALYS